MAGQVVGLLVDDVQDAGYKSIEWDSSTLAGGVYFYRLDAVSLSNPGKTFMQVKKMILLK